MKINELSKMTNINNETIRMYRKMGFLSPIQYKNGYYDYSIADFSSLIYLRKLREYGMSLQDIKQYEHSNEPAELIAMLDEEEKTVEQQIIHLKQRQRFIKFEKRHILESVETGRENVDIMQSIDDKVDYYGEDVIFNALAKLKFDTFYLTSTTAVRIPKEVINGDIIDKVIPMDAGIGLYRFMIEQRKIAVPEHANIVPNGLCISQMVSLRNCTEINIQQLAPMIQYAKEIHKPFISDTTGYLARIRHDEKGMIFDFRIRACIEQNDIRDEEAREQM